MVWRGRFGGRASEGGQGLEDRRKRRGAAGRSAFAEASAVGEPATAGKAVADKTARQSAVALRAMARQGGSWKWCDGEAPRDASNANVAFGEAGSSKVSSVKPVDGFRSWHDMKAIDISAVDI